jgi:predicted PurR-regulated permease PerM
MAISPATARRNLIVLLLGAMVLVTIVFWPLAGALFLGAVLAGLLWPLQVRLTRHLNRSRGLSAATLVLATTILVAAPVVGMSIVLGKQAAEVAMFVSSTFQRSGVEGLLRHLPEPVKKVARDAVRRLPRDRNENVDASVQRTLTEQSGNAVAVVGTAISVTTSLAFRSVIMLIALYFFLYEGDRIVEWVDENAPLERGHARQLLGEFRRVSSAVVMSLVVTAAVQAGAALLGYVIASVPHPLFAASVTFIAAFIPGVGAGAACLAVAGIVGLSGHTSAAIFLAVWGLTVVSLVDNVLRAFLIKDGSGIHGAVVFFSLLGGLQAFGILGLILGPLAVALFLAILRMHRRNALTTTEPHAGIHAMPTSRAVTR